MSTTTFLINSENVNLNDTLKKLIISANHELRKILQFYQEEDTHNERIVEEFQIPSYFLSNVSNDLCLKKECHKVEESSNKLFIASLEKHLNSLTEIHISLEEYKNFVQREIRKYELVYILESQTSNDDLLDLTTLQTNVLKLQADIHQANEQQEQKKLIINKLSECFEISKKINEHLTEKTKLVDELKDLRHLPPNLSEAEKRLNELKKKFKEVCDQFSKEIAVKS